MARFYLSLAKRNMLFRAIHLFVLSYLFFTPVLRAQPAIQQYVIRPDRVFDGEQMHEGWEVIVINDLIQSAGPSKTAPADAIIMALKGCTLLPGLIEGHSHLFLHPYNEVSWDEQVLNESRAERTARAVNHAKSTLIAGFTTTRDLGTEGAGYDDVGLKAAIDKGVVPGPRMLIATRALVVTGSYGPKLGVAENDIPRGAAEVGGPEELSKEIRYQVGKGADVIKLYADYRWGLNKAAAPTFTTAELKLAVGVAGSSGRSVVVHASTPEGMRRAIEAGVRTIEHGDGGDAKIFALMKERGVALCPTLAAGDAVEQYHGWIKGKDREPARITDKRKSFREALAAGVTICMGGDVGVFAHGDNVREMEMMVEYGMKALDVLRSATSVNADVFGMSNNIGRIRKGLLADLIAVEGNPSQSIRDLRKIKLVMKGGIVYKSEQTSQ
jgi:imidazolonepropionase-like amidohydrolase